MELRLDLVALKRLRKGDYRELKASLVYIVSSRPAWAACRKCLKTQTNEQAVACVL